MSDALIDPGMIARVYDRLGELFVELDENPIDYGPARLQQKVAHCCNYRTECTQMENVLACRLQTLRREYRYHQIVVQRREEELLSTDREVMDGPSLAERKALARRKMVPDVVQMERYELAIQELELLFQVVKEKNKSLLETKRGLDRQWALIREERAMGSVWGDMDAVPPSKGTQKKKVTSAMDTIIRDVRHAISAAHEPSEVSEPVEDPFTMHVANESAVEAFLLDLQEDIGNGENEEEAENLMELFG